MNTDYINMYIQFWIFSKYECFFNSSIQWVLNEAYIGKRCTYLHAYVHIIHQMVDPCKTKWWAMLSDGSSGQKVHKFCKLEHTTLQFQSYTRFDQIEIGTEMKAHFCIFFITMVVVDGYHWDDGLADSGIMKIRFEIQ